MEVIRVRNTPRHCGDDESRCRCRVNRLSLIGRLACSCLLAVFWADSLHADQLEELARRAGIQIIEPGISTAAVQKSAASDVPLDRLSPEKRARASEVIQKCNQFRRLPVLDAGRVGGVTHIPGGGRLARHLGGWQVISWALLLALPVMLPLTVLMRPASFTAVGASAWWALGYVAVFSMLIGFVFWYRGLAQGGIAAVGQLQLLQPFFGLALAAGLLGEQVSPGMLGVTVGVILCVAGARRWAR